MTSVVSWEPSVIYTSVIISHLAIHQLREIQEPLQITVYPVNGDATVILRIDNQDMPTVAGGGINAQFVCNRGEWQFDRILITTVNEIVIQYTICIPYQVSAELICSDNGQWEYHDDAVMELSHTLGMRYPTSATCIPKEITYALVDSEGTTTSTYRCPILEGNGYLQLTLLYSPIPNGMLAFTQLNKSLRGLLGVFSKGYSSGKLSKQSMCIFTRQSGYSNYRSKLP
ncbi:hypothetical protein FO519_007452 [Halicephalobus sp. NKZ332]|nr:hypothetical protein FO519_007452 [Halicephalobus sp. NKZ332]